MSFFAMGCSDPPQPGARGEAIESSPAPLIGGRGALDNEFPSAVALLYASSNTNRCTMAKVGPRHFLSSADCVYDDVNKTVLSDVAVGSGMHISSANTLAGWATHVLTVQQVNLYPDWLPCAATKCNSAVVPDLALVVVDRDTPDITPSSVDVSPVELGSSVVKVGYGCETHNVFGQGRLKIGTSKTLGGTIASDPEAQAVNVLTEGSDRNSQAPSICSGDNGGPLYRDGSNSVVGINTGLYVGTADGGGSAWDYHARLDTSARFAVSNWLMQLGVNVVRSVSTPAPYKGQPLAIPGTIESEDYDFGGPEVAYHDTTPQNYPSGTYRVDGVDIDPCGDDGGGYNIGGTQPGEWLRYAAQATAGTYDVEIRAASPAAGRTLHVEIDGKDVTGSMTVASTGDWQKYQTVAKTGVQVDAGARVVRVVFDTGGVNLNWVRIGPHVSSCSDNAQNGSESDVDCGGACPVKCADGKRCVGNADCASNVCASGTCRTIFDGGMFDAGSAGAAGSGDAGMAGAGGSRGSATTSTSASTTTTTGAGGRSSTSTGSSSVSTGIGGAGPSDQPPPPSLGCGCRTQGSSPASRWGALFALLGAAMLTARRPRR
jgi:MYXO-CTERM domain-containing protein